jgi:hypothetical protein
MIEVHRSSKELQLLITHFQHIRLATNVRKKTMLGTGD